MAANDMTCDVAIYGSHWGAVTASMAVAAYGRSVILFFPDAHVGTPVSQGLGAIDVGKRGSAGIGTWHTQELFNRVAWYLGSENRYLACPPALWERVCKDALKDYGVIVHQGVTPASIVKSGDSITSCTLSDGKKIIATNWIDASEDGDLAVLAVAMRTGRESSAAHGESLAGYRPATGSIIEVNTDDGFGGLLWGVSEEPALAVGDADDSLQVYGWRLPLTTEKANKRPWPTPDGYDPALFELRRRLLPTWIAEAEAEGKVWTPFRGNGLNLYGRTLYGKVDGNSDVGWPLQKEWPAATHERRAEITVEMYNEWAGWLWWLANDSESPDFVREFMATWGLCEDEFDYAGNTTRGWPKEIYRRGVWRLENPVYRMTQVDIQTNRTKTDTIGLSPYVLDNHTNNQIAMTVGDITGYVKDYNGVSTELITPPEFGYSSIVPTDCDNLLVPNCHGATHVAYSSTRIDMWKAGFATVAGYAAAKSVATSTLMKDLVIADLQTEIQALGQVIHYVP